MNPKIYPHPELLKKLPAEAKTLFKVFGDDIRLVGGCVRDLLLEKEVNDFDFATRLLPKETVEILEKNKIKTVPTGIKFGTVTAVINKKNFEITTLRKDSETDGRHCKPEFVDDYALDAARRDFTINALYMDSSGKITDYFGGISDLKKQQVKFIGDANLRITEDFLRILRFFRFSARYAKSLDSKGLMACVKQKENLKKLSKERIRSEILKMFSSNKKENLIVVLETLKDQKIAEEIFAQELDIKALKALCKIEEELKISANLNLKIATVFLEKEKDLESFFVEICATNLEKKYFSFLFKNVSSCITLKELTLKDLKQQLAFADKELVLDSYLLNLAKNFDSKKLSEAKNNIQFLQNFSLPKFPLNGEDIISIGFKEETVGIAINLAKKFWAEHDFKSTKPELIKFLKNTK